MMRGKKIIQKAFSWMLAAVMLCMAAGNPGRIHAAETAPIHTDADTQTEAKRGKAAGADSVEAAGQSIDAVGADSPANPVHHCTKKNDGSDATDWSYVYFGSYPQTEVAGGALTASITGANFDEDGNAWVNGAKYRRVSKSETNNSYNFGSQQYRYFKWERIQWRVLANDGGTLFVMADKGLDCKAYQDLGGYVTWEDCNLRSWLNAEFYDAAFTNYEQYAIKESLVRNEGNPDYGVDGGNDTWDKIFLLSAREAYDAGYGFCETAWISSRSRCALASDYAYARGAARNADGIFADCCTWWLRTPGGDSDQTARIGFYGSVDTTGDYAFDQYVACVPAMQISLDSGFLRLEDDGTSGAGGEDTTEPFHCCTMSDDGSDKTYWSYIYFGSYPQTELTGSALTDAVREASYSAGGDAWVDGIKYRRIKKDGAYRYFRWERIRWRILANIDRMFFVAADQGLDDIAYQDWSGSATWANSAIRYWLNYDFYETAFCGGEQSAIEEQTVVNEDSPDYGTNGGSDTFDKLFLLSIGEAASSLYGFCDNPNTKSMSRRVRASDYARAMGADTLDGDTAQNCRWWLRSPGEFACNASAVDSFGSIDQSGWDVGGSAACVPALYLSQDSGLWHVADDGGSGEGGDDLQPPRLSVLQDQEVKTGENAAFTVEVNGGSPSGYTYQWYEASSQSGAGTKIDGADSPGYTVQNVDETLNGRYYYCVVGNGKYSEASRRAKLTVVPDTSDSISVMVVLMDRTQLELNVGEKGELLASVQPGNAADRTVTWSSSNPGVASVQAEDENAVITAVSEGTAVITAEAGGKTARCTVTVSGIQTPPQPGEEELSVSAPSDQAVKAGSSVTFAVTAKGGDGTAYAYQWYRAQDAADAGTKIDGAVLASYTIPAKDVTDSLDGCFFWCVVQDASKQAVSKRAKLTVQTAGSSSGGNTGSEATPGGDGGSGGTGDGDPGGSGGAATPGGTGGDNSGGDAANPGGTVNPGGSSGSSVTAKPKTPVRLAAPKLKAKLTSPTTVRLSWGKVKNASAYTIYRAESQKGKYKKIGTAKKTSYTDKKAKSGKTYYYKAKAQKGKTKSSLSRAVSKKIPGIPSMPKLKLTVKGVKVTLSWGSVKNADKVEIYVQADNGKWKKWKTAAAKKKKLTCSYNDIDWIKKCAFKIRGYSKTDGVAVYGSYSNSPALVK